MQCWIDSAAVLHSRIRRHSVASCPQVRNLSVQLRSLCRLHRSPFVRNLLHAEASVPSPMGCSLRSLLQDPATRSSAPPLKHLPIPATETSPCTRHLPSNNLESRTPSRRPSNNQYLPQLYDTPYGFPPPTQPYFRAQSATKNVPSLLFPQPSPESSATQTVQAWPATHQERSYHRNLLNSHQHSAA